MTPAVYFLACHNPVVLPGNPHQACASVWSATALLDERLPPGAGHLYRLVSEPDWRYDGDVIALSTVAAELGGSLDSVIPSWSSVINQLLHLTLAHQLAVVSLSLTQQRWELLMSPPAGQLNLITTAGSTIVSAQERSELLLDVAAHVHRTANESGPLHSNEPVSAPPNWSLPPMLQIAER
jgi:hypothetical protein